MPPLISLLSACLLLLPVLAQEPSSSPEGAPPVNRGMRDWPEDPVVFLIPVRQPIMQPQVYLVRRGVEKARELGADAVIFQMDTPGGSVQQMREIVNMMIDLDIPTYTLVESDDFSAGAIMALATDHIYMTPRSVIGDAMPVMMGPDGLQSLGEAEREKVESAMDAIVRGIAQAKGRDEGLIRAMVRREIEYTLKDGRVISEQGKILTMTNTEAEQLRPDGSPVLSEGTVEDLDNMLNRIGLGDAERIELLPLLGDELAQNIIRFSPILIALSLLFLFIEFQSPGILWAGAAGVVLLGVVFFGFHTAGLAGFRDLVFIAVGLLLLAVAFFVLPGFGVAGITGLICFLGGLFSAMTIRYPGTPGDLPGFDNVGNIAPALSTLSLAVIGTTLGGAFLLSSLSEKSLFGRRLVLADSLDPSARDPQVLALDALIGSAGVTATPLTPSGTVRIREEEFDALSDGEYLDPETPVRVTEVRNHRLIVTRTAESPA